MRAGDRRSTPERAFDYLLALSVVSWAVLGWTATTTSPSAVRAATCLLHLAVAYAVIRRGPLERLGSPRALLASLPGLVIAGAAFRLAAPLGVWPVWLEVVFLAGAALAIWTFVSMRSSFAVLPAKREIVSTGPFCAVRHPAYAGECLMILACSLSNPTLWTALVMSVAFPFIALRIHAEERLLSQSDVYRRYRARVRFRLLPCLW